MIEVVFIDRLDMGAGVVLNRDVDNDHLVSSKVMRNAKLGHELLTTFC